MAAEADAPESPAARALDAALAQARARGVALGVLRPNAPPGSKADAADVIRTPGGRALLRRLVAQARVEALEAEPPSRPPAASIVSPPGLRAAAAPGSAPDSSQEPTPASP